jgi:D-3-phosphoglycerate dehydrogenase
MANFTVIVTDDRFGGYSEEEGILEAIGARLEVRDLRTESEAMTALSQADGILLNLFPLTAGIISSLARCRVISRYGVGYDNVDLDAATEKGIWVARVPDYCHEEASDQALALLLGCIRKIAYKDRMIRQGRWNLHGDLPTNRVAGRTLGIIGYGRVGRALHRKVSGFGLREVLICDPKVDGATMEKAGGKKAGLSEVLENSDYVTLHVPLCASTRGMIAEKEIQAMKSSAILINTSRGSVVCQKALAAALVGGRIAGAGLDVFEEEPLPADSPLNKLDAVILSDHAAWYSEESMAELKTKAAKNVAAVLTGGVPLYPVNSPSVPARAAAAADA